MDWSASTLWWMVAGVLVACELASGTFYLLMLALGCVAGALAAHAGLGSTAQLLAAAALGIGSVLVWHLKRSKSAPALAANADPDVNLDIGSRVEVAQWQPDGTAQINYRGATWRAAHQGAGVPTPGAHIIRAVEGSQLMLERASS